MHTAHRPCAMHAVFAALATLAGHQRLELGIITRWTALCLCLSTSQQERCMHARQALCQPAKLAHVGARAQALLAACWLPPPAGELALSLRYHSERPTGIDALAWSPSAPLLAFCGEELMSRDGVTSGGIVILAPPK